MERGQRQKATFLPLMLICAAGEEAEHRRRKRGPVLVQVQDREEKAGGERGEGKGGDGVSAAL